MFDFQPIKGFWKKKSRATWSTAQRAPQSATRLSMATRRPYTRFFGGPVAFRPRLATGLAFSVKFLGVGLPVPHLGEITIPQKIPTKHLFKIGAIFLAYCYSEIIWRAFNSQRCLYNSPIAYPVHFPFAFFPFGKALSSSRQHRKLAKVRVESSGSHPPKLSTYRENPHRTAVSHS